MKNGKHAHKLALIVCASGALLASCASPPPVPDLGRIYNTSAQNIGDQRTPVCVIPGIMGSKLESEGGQKVWGAFTFGSADTDTPKGARALALPMEYGTPLVSLRDDVLPTEVLDVVVADVAIFRGLEFGAYVDILKTLAAGQYRDQSLGSSGAVDYGGLHYTCFQCAYDWRRDVSEQAVALHEKIVEAQQAARVVRKLPQGAPIKVDIVAHSMGGMVLRYYLLYGPHALPTDGSRPPVTWEGAQNISRAIVIGTPHAGSIIALEQLVDGLDLNPIFPNYRPAIIGTMPALYGLLTRPRHARVVDTSGATVDLYDPAVWQHYRWGIANEGVKTDRILKWLLPEAASREERHSIAIDHLKKCLAKAKQLHEALDVAAPVPPGLTLHLFAGDAIDTPEVITVSETGEIEITSTGPGDGTVTRDSALMDERIGGEWRTGLQSPIPWASIQFISADHLGLTASPDFADNALFLLLEAPKN